MTADAVHLARFKTDLLALTPEDIFARYIAPDTCMGLTNVDERSLRARIAERFEIELASVIIVGSAKLGFTLTHKKAASEGDQDRPPFSPFSENSDVDVAIVSDHLFDSIWKRCFEFWHSSGYGRSDGYWPRGKHFRDYVFRGWMRPDHLPSEGSFTYKSEWFDFFRLLTSERAAGDYKVTAGLYREAYFLKAYQQIAITDCKAGVGTGL